MKKISKSKKRLGFVKTRRGAIATPVFMPVATQGAVKNLTPEELKSLGAEIILGNTYHLWLRPGSEQIKKFGGLHKFMNWNGPILTDSGGYQVFSLGMKTQGRSFSSAELAPPSAAFKQSWCEKLVPEPSGNLVKLSDKGVEFRDPFDGKKYFLSPEKSIQIQLDLSSDIIMVLDECVGYPASHIEAEQAVKRTTGWARRCKKCFDEKTLKLKIKKPLLFGIVQGSVYKDLRIRSAKELLEIGFDGYAVGGVAVGEPRKYLGDVLEWVLPFLPENKPKYLMGLGRPEEIVSAVEAGIDMFDCVIPTREARHGRLYKFKANINEKDFYETLQITNAKFARDFNQIDESCKCYTCRNFSLAYLNHLFKTKEPLAMRLASMHNLRFYLDLMEKLKNQ